MVKNYKFTEEGTALELPNILNYLKEVSKKAKDDSLENYDAFYFNIENSENIEAEFGIKEMEKMINRYIATLSNYLTSDELIGKLGADNFVALIRKGKHSDNFKKLLSETKIRIDSDSNSEIIKIKSIAGILSITKPYIIESVVSGPAVAYSYAKKMGKDNVYLSEDINENEHHVKLIEESFEQALHNDEFSVYYQPKVNSVTGKIIGAEALSRWNSGNEVVSPFAFIPILEKSGKVIDLDIQVLETVCKDMKHWKDLGNVTVPVSVNFSRRDLKDDDLPERIVAILQKYGIEKNEVVIEVTESASEEKYEQMAEFLNKLKSYGIATSIDDFGTGYSSLSVLREFPVSEIKIDRSFINKELDDNDRIIIQSIIDMAHKLGIEVITEGVENEKQKNFLHELGCDKIQGFLYDKPLSKEKFEERLKSDGYIKNIQIFP